MNFQIFGYLSGVFILLSFIPYFIGIFRHKTKPERASWLIWSILGSVSFFSQLAKGAHDSLWLAGVQTLGDTAVFLLAIKYGFGGFLKRDITALVAAAASLVLWYLTKEASVALFIAIFIDGLGAMLTMIKSYELPSTEPMTSWILTALGGLAAIFAVENRNIVLLAFPIYVFVINIGIIASIFLGKTHSYHNLKTPP